MAASPYPQPQAANAGSFSTLAAHHPYYGHGGTTHGALTDTVDRIPAVYVMPITSDGTVRVIRPYYG